MTLSKVHSNNRRARPLVFASASVEHHLRHRRHHHRRCCDSEYHHCVRCSDKAFESAATLCPLRFDLSYKSAGTSHTSPDSAYQYAAWRVYVGPILRVRLMQVGLGITRKIVVLLIIGVWFVHLLRVSDRRVAAGVACHVISAPRSEARLCSRVPLALIDVCSTSCKWFRWRSHPALRQSERCGSLW